VKDADVLALRKQLLGLRQIVSDRLTSHLFNTLIGIELLI
jgi:hypothetical protein